MLFLCFYVSLQRDLDSILETWNAHHIRTVRHSRSPSGRPSLLHSFPELYGTHDYLFEVSDNDFDVCKEQCVFRKPVPCDEDVFEMCSIIVAERDLPYPTGSEEALDLYLTLRQATRDWLGVHV